MWKFTFNKNILQGQLWISYVLDVDAYKTSHLLEESLIYTPNLPVSQNYEFYPKVKVQSKRSSWQLQGKKIIVSLNDSTVK